MFSDKDLLLCLDNKQDYDAIAPHVQDHAVNPTTLHLIKDIGTYYAEVEVDTLDWQELAAWLTQVHYARKDKDKYADILSQVQALVGEAKTKGTQAVYHSYLEYDYGVRLLNVAAKIVDGEGETLADALEVCQEGVARLQGTVEEDVTLAHSDRLSDVLATLGRDAGYKWRLEDLNVGVGPVVPGDCIIVGARPETGKTSFVLSEALFMAVQREGTGPVLVFNNEEAPQKLVARAYQVALGVPHGALVAKPTQCQQAFDSQFSGKLQVIDSTQAGGAFTTSWCDRVLARSKPSVVVFNVLDKVQLDKGRGVKDGNSAERLQHLGAWAREVAKVHNCVVFVVVQADATAEGEAWLHQGQLYGSKTGLQGEADLLILIGKVHDIAQAGTRFIHIAKNKLPGDENTDPKLKHGNFEVAFSESTGRFTSKVYKNGK